MFVKELVVKDAVTQTEHGFILAENSLPTIVAYMPNRPAAQSSSYWEPVDSGIPQGSWLVPPKPKPSRVSTAGNGKVFSGVLSYS